MYEIIGKCSICGGQVEAFVGPWYGTHPPRARCRGCGAVEATSENIIPMVPASMPKAEDWAKKYYSYEKSDIDLFTSFQDRIKEFADSFKWIRK